MKCNGNRETTNKRIHNIAVHNHNHTSTALHLIELYYAMHTNSLTIHTVTNSSNPYNILSLSPYTIRAPCLCARHFMCKYPIEQFGFDSVTLHVKFL